MAGPAKSRQRFGSFSSYPHDPNHQVISSGQNYFMTTDATVVNKVSPLAFTTTVQIIAVPAAATMLRLKPTVAMRISEEPTANANYYVISPGEIIDIPCASPNINPNDTSGSLYIRGDALGGTLQFMFLNV